MRPKHFAFGISCFYLYYFSAKFANNTRMFWNNISFSIPEVDELKELGETVSMKLNMPIKVSEQQKYMVKSKNTVIILGEGLHSLVQLAYLNSLDKYNVVLITDHKKLSQNDEFLPSILTILDNSKLDHSIAHDKMAPRFYAPYYLNKFYLSIFGWKSNLKVHEHVEKNYEILENLCKHYNIDIAEHILQTDFDEIKSTFGIPDEKLAQIKCLDTKKFMESLEAAQQNHKNNPIIIKGVEYYRPAFIRKTAEFCGVLYDKKVIFGDYIIISSQDNCFINTEDLGSRMPFLTINLQNEKINDHKLNIDITPDNRPIIGKNLYLDDIYYNLGYGAWQNGLCFWGASKIADQINNSKTEDESLYSSGRFFLF